MNETLSKLFEGCRTYRRFTKQAVPRELMDTLTDVARQRSCARNGQELRFIEVIDSKLVQAMQPMLHWAASLPKEIGTPKEGEQPTAFIVVLRPKDAGPLVSMDVGIALDAMAITAWASGVGSCIMASVNRPQIAQLLDIPDDFVVSMVLALGYPAHKSTITPPQQDSSLTYYVDEDRNYYVPKRPRDSVVDVM